MNHQITRPNRFTKNHRIVTADARLPRLLRRLRYPARPELTQGQKVGFDLWEESDLLRPVTARIIKRVKNAGFGPLRCSTMYSAYIPGLGRTKLSEDAMTT